MEEYIFDDEPDLGGAIEKVTPFCKLDKNMDVPPEIYVTGAFEDLVRYPGLVGKKWSRLCGFTFKSKFDNGHMFQFVYVPKFKGNIVRNLSGLAGWYCWDVMPDKTRKVITMQYVLQKFNFNITKFVYSDYFDKWCNIFVENVNYALSHQLEDLLGSFEEDTEQWREFKRYIYAIREAINRIFEVKKIVTDDEGKSHIKLAYNAYDNYKLKNLDKKMQDDFKGKMKDIATTLKSYRRRDQEA